MTYMLEDITVIDAASFLAGPGAATIMADFGANVIKIEPPGGDGYRKLVAGHPVPYHWLLTSRNKKSLGLDLGKPEGRALLHELVAKADVLTTNFLEPALARFEMEYERLKAINPRLIFAHLTGYGTEGPDVERRAFDVTAWWARSGMMEFIRDPGQRPLAAAPGMGDHSTATALFGAIMTGLYRRERTGEGCRVSTSLVANGVWANGMALQGVVAGNDLGVYRQEKGWLNPLTQSYQTSDGRYVVFAIINVRREWPRLCEALEHPEWVNDERFASEREIGRNREVLFAMITQAVSRLSFAELCKTLDANDITYGPIAPMADVLTDEQMRANNIVIETHDPGEGYALTINSPINVVGEAKKPPKRAPDIGADSVAVLLEMGVDKTRVQDLLRSGAVIVPPEPEERGEGA